MYQLYFYVPASHSEAVKNALFAKGAGRFAGYDSCAWECSGMGQFRPLAGSTPFIGSRDKLERVPEVKVEMIVPDEAAAEVVAELRRSHPYEEPAFGLIRIEIPAGAS